MAFKNPNIISADPEITVHEVDWDEDEFVIIATDGVWDVFSDKDAVRVVQPFLRRGCSEVKAAEELVRKACERGSHDDCTAIVIRFGWLRFQNDSVVEGFEVDASKAEEEARLIGRESENAVVEENQGGQIEKVQD